MSIVVDQPAAHVLTIGINRPTARNAVDGPTARALAEEFRAFDTDPELHVAVLYGMDGVFCAGADLKQIGSGNGNRVEVDMSLDGPLGPTRILLDKPVIAAVEGYAVAGGLELALAVSRTPPSARQASSRDAAMIERTSHLTIRVVLHRQRTGPRRLESRPSEWWQGRAASRWRVPRRR